MISQPEPSLPGRTVSKAAVRRAAALMAAPVAAYALVRPLVSSDALGLGIATAIPIVYSGVLAVARRRIDPLAVLSAAGFSLACAVSVLAGGSSLPIKLHEALITFAVGLALLVAVLIRRPLPIARLLRVPNADPQVDGRLGTIVGGFLVLHATLHIALAASLPTSSYLVAGRVIDWGTVALGILGASAYMRRIRARRDDGRGA